MMSVKIKNKKKTKNVLKSTQKGKKIKKQHFVESDANLTLENTNNNVSKSAQKLKKKQNIVSSDEDLAQESSEDSLMESSPEKSHKSETDEDSETVEASCTEEANDDDGNGLANESSNAEDNTDDDDEMGLESLSNAAAGTVNKSKKKRKKGIIYVSNIPKHMNVTRIREILGVYGKIGRVYLQPEKLPGANDKQKKKKRKPFARHFTEGWVEFESKRVAKQIVPLLNNKQISSRKKSQFFDYLWSMKYLPRFKWVHLTERMNYEQAVHKQRLMTEVSQARKETTFFQNNLDKSEFIKKKEKKLKKLEAKKQNKTAEV